MAFSVVIRYPINWVDDLKFATVVVPDPVGDAIAAGLVRDTRVDARLAEYPPPETATKLPRLKVIGGL